MRRSYIICPYCKKETALQGIDMHVKSQHPEQYAEYRKNYDTLKKTAVRKEISTRPKKTPASAPKPPDQKPEVTAKPPKIHLSRQPVKRSTLHPAPPPPAAEPPAIAPTAPEAPGGEPPAPGQGAPKKSFLDELSEVPDAVLEWINTP